MPLQEMGSVLLGVYWWGVFEKSCVCSRSGQQVWKLPNRAPALFCYYIFLGTWRGSRWARCSERPSAGLCFIWVIAGLRLRIRFIIIFLSNLQLCMPDIWWSPLVGCALSRFNVGRRGSEEPTSNGVLAIPHTITEAPLRLWGNNAQGDSTRCNASVVRNNPKFMAGIYYLYHRLQVWTVQGADKMCISYQRPETIFYSVHQLGCEMWPVSPIGVFTTHR